MKEKEGKKERKKERKKEGRKEGRKEGKKSSIRIGVSRTPRLDDEKSILRF